MSIRRETDWESKLEPSERGKSNADGVKLDVVYLRGLQRLADEAGIKHSSCVHQHVNVGKFGFFQCIYTVHFDDDTTWVGTADCNNGNTDDKFFLYPTAVAESRAEARALRKALGIRILSSEEIGFNQSFSSNETSPDKKISGEIIRSIELLCQTKNIDTISVIEACVSSKSRAMEICELKELTASEGQAAMVWLNEAKGKKNTAKEARDARKKELEGKLDEN